MGKTVPEVLDTQYGPTLAVNNILIFFKNLTNGCGKNLNDKRL